MVLAGVSQSITDAFVVTHFATYKNESFAQDRTVLGLTIYINTAFLEMFLAEQ